MIQSALTKDLDPLSGTVAQQTDFDVTIGQWVVSDSNLSSTSYSHQTPADSEISLLP